MNNIATETAKVAVLTGERNFDIKKLPVPEISDDEILVKVEGCVLLPA